MRLLQALADVTPESDSKLVRGLRARRGLLTTYAEWGASGRDPSRPLLWVHAPSVGEALQAQPVLQLLRLRRPDVQLAYTFFSPSAEPFAARIPADFRAYLPFDHPRDCLAALTALDPWAIAFCKADVWPNLVDAASHRRVALGLISGTVPAGSMRLRAPALGLMRGTFQRLDRVGAIDPGDAERLRQMGVAAERISETGDTRYDQVWERASGPRPDAVQRLTSERPTLVAGSTWPSDEEALLPVVRALRRSRPELRLIIAPHEVTASRIEGLLQSVSAGARAEVLSRGAGSDADVIVVDSYGVLGDLYALADAAFVGGGFHRAGLHSVLEPAAFGAPVAFGPRHTASRDARLLIAAGGARAVKTRAELETLLSAWFGSRAERETAGRAARELVRSSLGAAERSYALVAGLLELRGMARPR